MVVPRISVVLRPGIRDSGDGVSAPWRSEKAILPLKPILIHLLKGLEMSLNAPVLRGIMRIARKVNWGRIQHG